MALLTKAARGTQDVVPKDSYKWQFIEDVMRKESAAHGFSEIRTPVFEHTELFLRSVGETTDVVQKEMYTFEDKGGRSITLRPEGTAGAIRAMLEHGLYNDGLPVKTYYFSSCYRYEKPQAGRLREFHQFGLEIFGTSSPAADAELISMVSSLFERLQVKNLSLQINSIGCPACREKFQAALREYFKKNEAQLCETCHTRLEKNPMRIFDCKSPICQKIAAAAPVMLDFLCEECKEHFETVEKYLDTAKISYIVNPKIVRGLDYYTKTVFEFVSNEIGAQGTICGGGRYDGLVEELGGQSMPSLGFGLGMERLLLLLEIQKIELPSPPPCDLYIASLGDAAGQKAFELVRDVRNAGLIAQNDIVGRSLKAQMKYADKLRAKFSMVLGDNEIKNRKAKIRNMKTREEVEIDLGEDFFAGFFALYIEEDQKRLTEEFSIS